MSNLVVRCIYLYIREEYLDAQPPHEASPQQIPHLTTQTSPPPNCKCSYDIPFNVNVDHDHNDDPPALLSSL
jgi:hypothetical protein